MKNGKKRLIIIGILAIFLISGFNPANTNNLKAGDPPIEDLTVIAPTNPVYEYNEFSVSVEWNGDLIQATVTYDSQVKTGAVISFEAKNCDAARDVSVEHWIYAQTMFDADGDGINETHEGKAPVYVLNRYLVITKPEDKNDNEKFDIRVEEIGNPDALKGGATVTIDFGSFGTESRLTGPLESTITKFQAPVHEPGQEKFQYSISATKDECLCADNVDLTVWNTNVAPNKPSDPKTGQLINRYHVGVDSVNVRTKSADYDKDNVKYKVSWGDGESSWSEYSSQNTEVTLSHVYHINVPDRPKDVDIKVITAEDDGVDKNGNSDVKSWDAGLINLVKTTVKIINDPPNDAKVSGDTQFEDTTATLTFTGSDSSSENHPIYFKIHWGDNTNERYPASDETYVDSGTSFEKSHTYTVPGKYCVSVTVHDKYGKSKKSSCLPIVVDNLAPNKPKLSVKRLGGGTFSASVSTNDPNTADKIKYEIDWDGVRDESDEWCTNGCGDSFSYTFSSNGIKLIKARAFDEKGSYGDWETKRVGVLSIEADAGISMELSEAEEEIIYEMIPKITIDETGNTAIINNSYSVIANTDGTYDVQQYDQTIQSNVESAEAVQNYIINNGNTDTTDTNDDEEDENENHEPSLTCPTSKTVTEGNSVSFTVTASDPDGDSITITAYKKSGSGSISTSSSHNTNYATYATYATDDSQSSSYISKTITYYSSEDSDCNDETAEIEIIATDSYGHIVTKDVTIYINDDDEDNTEPSLTCPISKTVTEGNSVSFTVTASDPDGDSITITAYKTDGPGSVSVYSSYTNYATYSSNTGSGTSYTSKIIKYYSSEDSDCNDETAKIKVTATDSNGDSVSKTVTININDDDSCDSCCFPAGTQITMADYSTKKIEDVCVGEFVLSYDTSSGVFVNNIVKELVSPIRNGVYSINDGLIMPTDDHPFYTQKPDGRIGWASIKPEKTQKGYKITTLKLEIGDMIYTQQEQWIKIKTITYQKGPIQTYNLEDVSGKSNFFANQILVHNAADCDDSNTPDSNGGSTFSYSSYTEDSSEYIGIKIQFDSSGTFLNFNEENNNVESNSVDNQIDGNSNSFLFSESSLFMYVLEIFAERFPLLKEFLIYGGIITEEIDTTDDQNTQEDETQEGTDTEEQDPEEDSNDEILTQEDIKLVWDFGDGTFGKGVKPIHEYNIAIDDTDETAYQTTTEDALSTYYVTLYVLLDIEDELENLEITSYEDLSEFDIIDTDTTTITVKKTNDIQNSYMASIYPDLIINTSSKQISF